MKYVDVAIQKRKQITALYRQKLKGISGITVLNDMPNVEHGYSYFPILIDSEKYGQTRDDLYEKLKENNIYSRRYFYPLISQFPTYRGLHSARSENLPVAEDVAKKVLCLPLFPDLNEIQQDYIIDIIKIKRK